MLVIGQVVITFCISDTYFGAFNFKSVQYRSVTNYWAIELAEEHLPHKPAHI